jgi:Xaa-Pro aminopeptidase
VDAEALKKSLKDRQSELVSLSENLVDAVWGADRPARVLSPVFSLSMEFSGTICDEVLSTPC